MAIDERFGRPGFHIDSRVLYAEGERVEAAYRGPEPLASALASNAAGPLSLASADFDGDGTADLACGYGLGDRGAVAVFRGNPDAVYPKWARPIRHANEQAVKDADAWLRAYRQHQR